MVERKFGPKSTGTNIQSDEFDPFAEFRRRYPTDRPLLEKLSMLALREEIPWEMIHTFLIGKLAFDHLTPETLIADTFDIEPEEVADELATFYESPEVYALWQNIVDAPSQATKNPKRTTSKQPKKPETNRAATILPKGKPIKPTMSKTDHTSSPEAFSAMVEEQLPSHLNDLERCILPYVQEGRTARDIAPILGIPLSEIRLRIDSIVRKLHVHFLRHAGLRNIRSLSTEQTLALSFLRRNNQSPPIFVFLGLEYIQEASLRKKE